MKTADVRKIAGEYPLPISTGVMMMGPQDIPNDEAFRAQVRDALLHLYDSVYLGKHRLTEALFSHLPATRSVRSKALRMWLLDGIEALRPAMGTPENDASWRTYRILSCRYVESCTTAEVMQRVNLGHSHYHEQHRQALDRLLDLLCEQIPREASDKDAAPGKRSLLQREIQVVARSRSDVVDVHDLAQSVLAMVAPLANERGTELCCNTGGLRGKVTTQTDALLLRQLLMQLLGNALRVVERSRVELVVTTQPRAVEFVLVLPTVPADDRAIVDWATRDLARALEGTLDEVSGKAGSRVCVRLPLGRHRQLVLIDNDPGLADLFTRYLRDSEWELVATQSADEGLRLAVDRRPEAIILDVIMPDRDGWEVLAALRAKEITPRATVIVCSVLEQPELAQALGADMFLPKPVSQVNLLQALEQLR